MATANRYAVGPGSGAEDQETSAPDFRYAAPSLEDNPYPDVHGWAPAPNRTDADQRLGRIPSRSFRLGGESSEAFYETRHADTAIRHSVEFLDADGFEIVKGELRRAPDPRWTPPRESRPTQRMSPHTYVFTRPFDQHSARRFNGSHFSMADHRRDYDILGMAPVRQRRNTSYRIPAPWDTDLVDEPVEMDVRPQGIPVIDLPPPSNRSFRLG